MTNNPFDEINDKIDNVNMKIDELNKSVNVIIEMILSDKKANYKSPLEKDWMSVNELIEYLPSHPAPQTVYSWVFYKKIPYHKKGRRLFFRKDEIDASWVNGYEKK